MVKPLEKPPELDPIVKSVVTAGRLPRVLEAVKGAMTSERYLHWAELRYRKPPADLSREEWWLGLKWGRSQWIKSIPLTDLSGSPFYFSVPEVAQRRLHEIDQQLSGQIAVSEVVTHPATRDRYVVSSLIEEAITSSQLEGASTTRRVARDMLRSGRPPKDKSERMIINNYVAMRHVVDHKDEELTPEFVLELHGIVSRETLSTSEAEGRLQTPEEDRVAVWGGNRLLHQPPPASELPDRLALMCAFANGTTDDGFIHPVLRAIMLHFWLAYEHPFEDGNGRTARALFYWSMLKQSYWLAEFLTISSILRAAPAQYANSYLLTESDGNDLTYFILYQINVVVRAMKALQEYLRRKMMEIREAETYFKGDVELNHRQLGLLSHAIRHPGHAYTVESHRGSNQVVYQTARSDLIDLQKKGLLECNRRGRRFVYVLAENIEDHFKGSVPAHGPS
ncbi:MAG: Fic family protein [Candidatus Dormiibacterota bacterium]